MEQELGGRTGYDNKLLKYKYKDLIKVITGIRRSGKSSLMQLFIDELRESGVPEKNILAVNFELIRYDLIRDYHALYDFLIGNMPAEGRAYIFLDEVQQVAGWERVVNSIRIELGADIYITGSNSWLLSSEIATLLSGRYVEIDVLPLSFTEYCAFMRPAFMRSDSMRFDSNHSDSPNSGQTMDALFNQYLKFGGFPAIPALPQDNDTINDFLMGIYNSVIIKDVLARQNVQDIKLLEQLVKFLMQNTGNLVSPANIARALSGQNSNIKSTTISNYLTLLEKAFIVYPAYRYDIKGKELLKTLCKYYVVDTGLRNAFMGYSNADYGAMLETVVYFELRRRRFQVFAGKHYEREIDFIAVRQDEKRYYQVSASILDEETRMRELAPLLRLKDNYEKIILTMDTSFITDYDGIKQQNIIDFLRAE
jgi:predicted AAA+ superfamily ATPase